MDVLQTSNPPADAGADAPPAWSAADLLARILRAPPKRRLPRRLKVFFLRQLRHCGEVSLAAKRTGVPLSTLYRWRARDAKFRGHWDDILEQRRQIAEDRLMAILREGELRCVYYKGLKVGWRRTFTHLASIRVLDYLDRRGGEKMSRNPSRFSAAESMKNSGESAA